jgi:DNA-binding CsgD family transcriptional regulator
VLFERAIALADTHGTIPRTTPPRVALAEQRLWLSGDLAGARELLEIEHDALRRRGREFERQRVLRDLADIELCRGAWDDAERLLEETSELALDAGDRFSEVQVWSLKALLDALRGDVEETRRLAGVGMAHGEAHWPMLAAENRWVLGQLELSLGEPERAWSLLADATERVEREWAVPRIPDAVEALVDLGRLEEAEGILAPFEARWSEHRWAVPAALRCRALLLLSRGEAGAAVSVAEEAALGFEAGEFPLDRGRSLIVAGEALRPLGERRRAAEKLEAAQAIFAELGARIWLERAEKELRRARPRPRRDRELTSAERRVAALVAAGKTNREVAAQLFTTVSTVEAHLTRIYRKAGVRSRTELARRVADGAIVLDDE